MTPAIDRFLSKVEVDDASGCWLWKASVRPNGYGQFRISTERNGYPHLFAYEHFVGEIPEGHQVDHLCEVKLCVNPAHLEAVQPWVNVHRSGAPTAINARKTSCKRGHKFTAANTRIDRRGSRVCRTCMRAHFQTWVADNPDRYAASQRRYNEANVEKLRESARERMRAIRKREAA